MKKVILVFLSALFAMASWAQQDNKSDVILKVNGEELKGKIIEVNQSEVKFSYTGETAVYVLNKSEISKIIHASGRVEMFGNQDSGDKATGQDDYQGHGKTDTHNKVAILPFNVIRDNETTASDAMSFKVQTDAYTYLAKHSAGFKILDIRTTDAILQKAGITKETIMGFTMQELCNTLGVEYIIDGIVSINKTVQSTSTSNNYSNSRNNNGKNNNNNQQGYSGSSSYSSQQYQTSITINIFNDKNENIYNQSHNALLQSVDGSYTATLDYLLKRCPLYRK